MSRFEVVFRKQNYKKSAIKQLYTPDYLPSINDLLYPTSSCLVWFGLYICPTKPKPIYGVGQKKMDVRWFFVLLAPDFSFPQLWFEHRIWTQRREHRGLPWAAETSWSRVVFRVVFKTKEKAATICFVTAWFLRGGPTWAWTKDSLIMSQVL